MYFSWFVISLIDVFYSAFVAREISCTMLLIFSVYFDATYIQHFYLVSMAGRENFYGWPWDLWEPLYRKFWFQQISITFAIYLGQTPASPSPGRPNYAKLVIN